MALPSGSGGAVHTGFEAGRAGLHARFEAGKFGFRTILPVWPMADTIASARGRSAPAASRARVALEMSKGGEVMARPAW